MDIQKGLQVNIEPHIYIEKEVQELKFGTITLTMRIHEGKIEDITLQEFKRKKFGKVDKRKTTVIGFEAIVQPTE